MDYLFFKYGTRLVVSSKMLEELESCKPPTSDSLEGFLVNVVVTCEFVMRLKQTTHQRLNKIVSNNFEQTLSLEWAKRLLKLKEECKSEFATSDPSSNFEESWQTSFGGKILTEFSNWCKELVALHRTVKLPGKVSHPQASGRQPNQVKATTQPFKCILCSGTHPGRRGQVRRYLSTCNLFLEMSVPQRWNTVRRHKFCQVCLTQDDHGQHGQSC